MLVSVVRELDMTLGQLNGFHPAQLDTMQNLSQGNCSIGFEAAKAALGRSFLGPSSCESGARYMNSYASKGAAMTAATAPDDKNGNAIMQQLASFDQWMEREYETIGRQVVALTTTAAEAHVWLETGFFSMVGSETAQTDGNVHVHYAFNRGAAKQHGVQLHADVSVYTYSGHKVTPCVRVQCRVILFSRLTLHKYIITNKSIRTRLPMNTLR